MTAQPNRADDDPLIPVRRSKLLELLDIAQGLTVDRRDPEKFHEDKSDLVTGLRSLTRAKAEAAAP